MLFGTAVTIQHGKLDRFRGLDEELDEHRDEYEALNARFGVRAHSVWAFHQLDGTPIALNLYDIEPEGLQAMAKREWDLDSPYDRWWVGWVDDIYGIDLLGGATRAGPPERVLAWESGG
jgi:hypothetical protein